MAAAATDLDAAARSAAVLLGRGWQTCRQLRRGDYSRVYFGIASMVKAGVPPPPFRIASVPKAGVRLRLYQAAVTGEP